MFGGEESKADITVREGDIGMGDAGREADQGWGERIVGWDGDGEVPETTWDEGC